eukprot:3461061-Prymnesium_polylepis.1
MAEPVVAPGAPPGLTTFAPPTFAGSCRWTAQPLRTGWPTFTLSHYADSERYARFEGRDLTPWNHGRYPFQLLQPFARWRDVLEPRADERIVVQKCAFDAAADASAPRDGG